VLEVSGAAGREYELKVWGASEIQELEGANLERRAEGGTLRIKIQASESERYPHTKIVFHFSGRREEKKKN
jgi:hypothetical protein